MDVQWVACIAFAVNGDVEAEGLYDGQGPQVVEPGTNPIGLFLIVGDDDMEFGVSGTDRGRWDSERLGRRRSRELGLIVHGLEVDVGGGREVVMVARLPPPERR